MRIFFGAGLAFLVLVAGSSASHAVTCGEPGLISWARAGKLLIAAGVLNEGLPACSADVTLRVSVRHRDGTLVRGIHGNPFVRRVRVRVAPWAPAIRSVAWRNWCGRRRGLVLRITIGAKRERAPVPTPPACRSSRRPSTISPAPLPFTGDPIPAHMLSPDTPVPVSPSLLRVSNGWLVSNGRTLVAVYAGEAGNDPSVGRFVIIRQNLVFGIQTRDIVDTGQTNAVRITNSPTGRSVETSAQHADLTFSSSTAHGILRLATDEVLIL